MKNILVTGGAGFIGSNFVRYLLEINSKVNVVNFDLLTYAGNLANLENLSDPSRYYFVEGNICEGEKVRKVINEYEIDTIVNCAAETHVDRSILEPTDFVQTNVTGTLTLLEAAKEIWGAEKKSKIFHHISTDEVYGSLDKDSPAFSEDTAYNPRSPYSASKAASDHLVRAFFHTHDMNVTITNCSNNYGPYQFPEKLIPFTILCALHGDPIPIYGDGKQIRDWLYVKDHCEAIYLVLEKGKSGETYNIGGNNQIQNIDLVRKICKILDELRPAEKPYESLISYVPDRYGHDRRYAMNFSKISIELGWFPKYDIHIGLYETVKWYAENFKWMQIALYKLKNEQWFKKNYLNRG